MTNSILNLDAKINLVQTAANMVEVDSILSSVTADYITKYANEVEKAPTADVYRSQVKWVGIAVRYFLNEIESEKKILWNNIPARFVKSHIYQRLQPKFSN